MTHDGSTVILTGMSGAGKQLAARVFEDMGWRVVDNLPPRLLPSLLVERSSEGEKITPLCVVCDVRGGRISELIPQLVTLEASGQRSALLFLDASDDELVCRFKETRRPHPLFDEVGGVLPAIARERMVLETLRERADMVIDTSDIAPSEMRRRIVEAFGPSSLSEAQYQYPLTVTVASFGFKHGVPTDSDLLFDVRFLRNPHYVDELRPRDGRDPAVAAYVAADERTDAFLERMYDLVGWTLPHYVSEGKAYLTIGIGCTGGRHRSVMIAERLGTFLRDRGYRTLVQHRDLARPGLPAPTESQRASLTSDIHVVESLSDNVAPGGTTNSSVSHRSLE